MYNNVFFLFTTNSTLFFWKIRRAQDFEISVITLLKKPKNLETDVLDGADQRTSDGFCLFFLFHETYII